MGNRYTPIAPPYADVDDIETVDAIRRAGNVAEATGQASLVTCSDGRKLVVPPQPVRHDDDLLRRHNDASQSIRRPYAD